MSKGLIIAIIIVVLACFLIYLIMWTIGFFTSGLSKKREKQREESKEKIESIRLRTIGCSKNYWYNKRDVEDCTDNRMKEKLYHYFDDVDDCINDLVIEMYDCALVRTEELSRIVYGESVFDSVSNEAAVSKEKVRDAYREEKLDSTTEESEENDTDKLYSDEDEVTDLLTSNEEDSLSDEQKEAKYKKALEEDEDASSYNEELDADEYLGLSENEKRRRVAIKASVYEHWVGYVFQLYQLVDINANEDIKNRIRKELMHYGYNDIEVLLHSPEESFE